MCRSLAQLIARQDRVDGDCPYQFFHGRKPSIVNINGFCQAAYSLIPSQIEHNKLADTITVCVIVGYDDTKRFIGCLNSIIIGVMISSSCRFVKKTFPFRQEAFRGFRS